MKTYLLIAGYQYYPDRGTGDWIACYNTEEEANERINELKGECYDYDWFNIIDLKEWMYEDSWDAPIPPGVDPWNLRGRS